MGGSGMLPSEAELFAPLGDIAHIAVAVSGGADSLALMVLASRWAKAQTPEVTVTVYSVDHGLRSASAEDVAIVVRAATELRIRHRALTWQGDKPATGIQAAARAARYRLIGDAMRADGAKILLTAHHARDQAETVLMRMAHGSGLKGLGGMTDFADVEGVKVFRPLLTVAPEDLAVLVQTSGFEPAIDPSNSDRTYERVRWRQVSPALDALGLDADRLGVLARRMQSADAALERVTMKALQRVAAVDDFGSVRINCTPFAAEPAEVRVRMIRQVLCEVGGAQKPFALQAIEDLVAKLSNALLKKTSLHGCLVARRDNFIRISREPARVSISPQQIGARQNLEWDTRFVIFNDGDSPVQVRAGVEMTRQKLEALLGRKADFPMTAVKAAPVVQDAKGDIVSLGRVILNPGIRVSIKIGSWVPLGL